MRQAHGAEGAGHAVDPRVTRSRAVIVEAASAHFLEHGYLTANLDDIAEAAGVSKRTIYNNYGDKEQLFREILREALDTAERFSLEVVGRLGTSDDVAGELHELAQRLAGAVLGGRIVALRRLLIGEATRFPELARDYYLRAPGRVVSAIADALHRYHERGLLSVDSPAVAAEQFAFLVLGASLDRALFEVGDVPSRALVEARAEAGAAAFLRAYGIASV